jgi:hypothetical protein
MRSVIILAWAWLAVQSRFASCQTITQGPILRRDGITSNSTFSDPFDHIACLTLVANVTSNTCFYGINCGPYVPTTPEFAGITATTENCPAPTYACETTTAYLGNSRLYILSVTCTTNPRATSTTLSYTGGDLLTGSCATPEFTLLPGPQSTIVYYAAFVGCVNNKPDCCPFAVSTSTSTTTEIVIATTTGTTTLTSAFLTVISPKTSTPSSQTSTGSIAPPSSVIVAVPITSVMTSGQSASQTPLYTPVAQQFPIAVSAAQSTLSSCPKDYHIVSSSCCPL